MIIHGFQKLTLLDFPTKTACTVFTGGCNLRCPFCHNAGLVLSPGKYPTVSEDEVFALLEKRKNTIDGVCITGGEPTLQPELPGFLEKLRRLGYAVKLDTNGTNPAMLKALLHERVLDYVAMDIKNSPSRYAETCGGIDCLSRVRESAALLMDGTVDYEFRTTVCAPLHTPRDMEELGRWLKGARRYFLQPFADSGGAVNGGAFAPFILTVDRLGWVCYLLTAIHSH